MSKKIMFSDRYGLTEAVLERRKTMTRRIIKDANLLQWLHEMEVAEYAIKGTILEEYSPYKVGEVVAIAQSYKDVRVGGYPVDSRYDAFREADWGIGVNGALKGSAGETNKMFVKADLMPHRIRITDIKVERLQDISDEDCLKEGIQRWKRGLDLYFFEEYGDYDSPREAFAALIDKVSGRGTWKANPWVFAYTYELVK